MVSARTTQPVISGRVKNDAPIPIASVISCAAASATSSSTPGCSRTAPSSTTSRTVPAAARRGQASRPATRAHGAARAGRPRPGVRQALPGPALRRPAAARRRRPGAGRRPAGDADGRAVRAVDPVVREQLQDEFLRLQGELGKTIVFVTHDIDEAIKLGDQVAVLRGRRHARPARRARRAARPPGRRLRRRLRRARPRLPRARLPAAAGACRLHAGAHGRARRDAEPAARASADGWVLVVDDDRAAGLGRAAAPVDRRPRHRDRLHRGGTVATRSRVAARRRSTPRCRRRAGRGVVVDDDGPAARHRARRTRCSTAIEAAERPRPSPRDPAPRSAARHGDLLPRPTRRHPRAGWAARLARRACRSCSGWSSRCRSAGWPAATAGSTRR